jgi:hypothetical protein
MDCQRQYMQKMWSVQRQADWVFYKGSVYCPPHAETLQRTVVGDNVQAAAVSSLITFPCVCVTRLTIVLAMGLFFIVAYCCVLAWQLLTTIGESMIK